MLTDSLVFESPTPFDPTQKEFDNYHRVGAIFNPMREPGALRVGSFAASPW